MFTSVAILGLLAAVDPVRLGVILLIISRPRPIQSLLAYGAGSLAACGYMVVLPLVALNTTPAGSHTQAHTDATMRHAQIGAGILALGYAALNALRLLLARDKPAAVDKPPDLPPKGLRARVRKLWKTGGLWVAVVIGIGTGGPPWDAVVLLLALVALSCATVGAQVGAAVILVIGMLAIIGVALIGHLINPTKAHAVLARVRD